MATSVSRCCSRLQKKFEIFDKIEDFLIKEANIGSAKKLYNRSVDDLKIYLVARSSCFTFEKSDSLFSVKKKIKDKNILNLWKCLSSQSLFPREASQHKKSGKNIEDLLELLCVSVIMPEAG